jgi:hypothetical protein
MFSSQPMYGRLLALSHSLLFSLWQSNHLRASTGWYLAVDQMAENQTLITIAPTQRSAGFLAPCSCVVALLHHFLYLSLHDRQSSKDIRQVVANIFIAGVLNIRWALNGPVEKISASFSHSNFDPQLTSFGCSGWILSAANPKIILCDENILTPPHTQELPHCRLQGAESV